MFCRCTRALGLSLATLVLVATATIGVAREISVQAAVARVQRETHGKILGVQTLRLGKHKVYRIKVLTPDGQVRVVQVAAEE
ncbi:MAG: hypothetical protein WBW61_05280 [Rhodanobacteraceae bacterium]